MQKIPSSAVGMYRGKQVALLTQHGKEHVIAQVLDIALGCRVERVRYELRRAAGLGHLLENS